MKMTKKKKAKTLAEGAPGDIRRESRRGRAGRQRHPSGPKLSPLSAGAEGQGL